MVQDIDPLSAAPTSSGGVGVATDQPLVGHRILLTGASRGIAAGLAERCAQLGAHVVVHYSQKADAAEGHPDAAQVLSDRIQSFGGKVDMIDADFADSENADTVMKSMLEYLGGIDGLVLSASIQIEKEFCDQTPKDVAKQFSLNMETNIRLLQGVLPIMAKAGYGRVLSIGSVQELTPSRQMPIYAMSKSAMKALIELLAGQYAAEGITLNTLSPGLIETDRNAKARQDSEAWQARQRAANPMGRVGQIEELLPAAVHLLSPQSSFITGATLYASGGSHITHPGRHGG